MAGMRENMRTAVKKNSKLPEAKTREAILLAAIEEFAALGFAGARTEHIARNANVNKAMLHYYYHDKETLYNAVLETLYGSMADAEELLNRLKNAQVNSAQMIHIFLKVMLQKHGDVRSNAFRSILAWELAAGQNNLKRVAQKYMVPRIQEMTGVIRRGIEVGELRCENPTLAVWSLISQVAFYFMHRKTYEGSEIYDELYRNVSQDDLLKFLLRNFISSYAVNSKINTDLPAEIANLADELGNRMATPSMPFAVRHQA